MMHQQYITSPNPSHLLLPLISFASLAPGWRNFLAAPGSSAADGTRGCCQWWNVVLPSAGDDVRAMGGSERWCCQHQAASTMTDGSDADNTGWRCQLWDVVQREVCCSQWQEVVLPNPRRRRCKGWASELQAPKVGFAKRTWWSCKLTISGNQQEKFKVGGTLML
jgi:hypothetical protein